MGERNKIGYKTMICFQAVYKACYVMTPIAEMGGHAHQHDAKKDECSDSARLLKLPKDAVVGF